MPEPSAAQPAPTPPTRSGEGARHRKPRRPQEGPQDQGKREPAPGESEPHKTDGAGKAHKPRAPRSRGGHVGEPSRAHPQGSAGPSSARQGGKQGDKGRGPGHVRGGANPGRGQPRPARAKAPDGEPSTSTDQTAAPKVSGRRGRKFNSELTEGDAQAQTARHDVSTTAKYKNTAPKADDLTSRLIWELSTPPYQDCIICFSSITPMQPTWSCSPSNPTVAAVDDENYGSENAPRANMSSQCCWVTFHLKCIKPWASKNVKEIEEAWRARGEERQGDWRCPGCQSKRTGIPSSYW